MKVLITDFGTALDWSDDSGATTTGRPGPITSLYAAPEVIAYERRNESSDIWSLGCVFLEMTVSKVMATVCKHLLTNTADRIKKLLE
jgi:serine/threonine protein kinase